VTRAGATVWVLRYRKPGDGRVTEASVGRFPILSLGDARAKARGMAREIELGRDPVEQKRQKREKACEQKKTFRAALDLYRDAPAFRDKAATAVLTERLERHAAAIMSKPLQSLDVQMIEEALTNVHASAPFTARRTLAAVARIWDFARIKGLIDPRAPNPATFRGGFEFIWGPTPATTHLRVVGYADMPALYAQLTGT
jgi:hypothetical protein